MKLLTKQHANQLLAAKGAAMEISSKAYNFTKPFDSIKRTDQLRQAFNQGVCYEAADRAKEAIINLLLTLEGF
jgi:hypothetical protein